MSWNPISWTADRRLDLALRIMATALVLQVGISWAAWSPGGRGFPATPVIAALGDANWASLGLLLGGWGAAGLLWRPRWWGGRAMLLPAMVLLVLGDLNRLQPWLYLYGIVLVATAGGKESGWGVIRLVIGFAWLWSGLMKLNPTFGMDFFPGLMEPFGWGEWAWEHRGVAYAAGGVEASAGLLFLLPGKSTARLQKCGLALGWAVHAFILASLGPFGLNWNPVVWPWNLAFMLMAALSLRSEYRLRFPLSRARLGAHLLVIVLVGMLPALNFVGCWDHFLSHSYYSGRVPLSTFYFHPDDRFHIPPSARPFVLEVPATDEYLIPLEQWALGEMKIPGYPEIWLRKSTAAALCACLQFPEKAGLEISQRTGFSTEMEVERIECGQLNLN